MKRILALASIAAVVAASGPVHAIDSVSGTANLSFHAGFTCTMNGNPFDANIVLGPDILDANGVVKANMPIGPLVPPNKVITCTGAGARLSAQTANGGLTLGNVPDATVARVGYIANVAWDGKVISLTANGNPGGKSVSDPTTLPVVTAPVVGGGVTIGGTAPLPSGDYGDTLKIQVGEAL
jgi:hypothetical protein